MAYDKEKSYHLSYFLISNNLKYVLVTVKNIAELKTIADLKREL